MSKTVELARHLETLHINNMYKSDFYWTWDKSDEEIDAVFTVADALAQVAQSVGYGKDSVDLVVGLVPGPVEVGLIHIVDVELLKMSCQFNSFAHVLSP